MSTFLSPSYLYYSDRPEWKDIQPIPVHTESPYPFAPISFSKEYLDAMAYYLVAKEETSLRLFELTTHLVALNSALYCVWHTRRRVLFELKLDLLQELEFLTQLLIDSPKNFQMWHHRQVIVQALDKKDVTHELEFINLIFNEDAKNYHAWIYLQWLVKQFDLWHTQLDFVNYWIDQDVRNHSAWTHRYFLVTHESFLSFLSSSSSTSDFKASKPSIFKDEVEYTLKKIELVLSNESAWTYLQGIEERLLSTVSKVTSFLNENEKEDKREVENVVTKIFQFATNLKIKGRVSPHLYSYLVDGYLKRNQFDLAIQ
ncbi:CAAX geranylgeranyltransferase alpha subunit, partial [Coelomomyces lativittatus]